MAYGDMGLNGKPSVTIASPFFYTTSPNISLVDA